MKFEKRLRLIRRSISVLIKDGSIAEIRMPRTERGPQCGLFSDLNALPRAAAEHSGNAPGVFVGLNPVRQSPAVQATNNLASATLIFNVASGCRLISIQYGHPTRLRRMPSMKRQSRWQKSAEVGFVNWAGPIQFWPTAVTERTSSTALPCQTTNRVRSW